MRKISKTIANAFNRGLTASVGNTRTDGQSVWLHGNKIAWRQNGNRLALTLANWPTVTTRERLNAILYVEGFDFQFKQVNHQQVLSRPSVDGSRFRALTNLKDTQIVTFKQGASYDNI